MAALAHIGVIVLSLLLCGLNQGHASSSVDTVGREFVFAFPTPYYPTSRYSSYHPYLYIVMVNPSSTQASVDVSLVSNSGTTTQLRSQRVEGTSYSNLTISFIDYFGSSYFRNVEEPKTIHLVSTVDITVVAHYSYNQRYSTWYATGMIILPVSALGTDHFVVSYRPYTNFKSEFTISATGEVTNVFIRGRDGYRAQKTLQPYETFQYKSSHDLTGSRIKSDNPISVIAGVSSVKVPDGVDYRSYFAVHMPSVDGVGREYVLTPFKDRTSGYIFRIVGTIDNTILSVDENSVELHAGEFYQGNAKADNITMITANKPVYVCQFMKGYAAESTKGNAAMLLVPALEMFSSASVSFAASSLPSKSSSLYHISITVRCEAKQGLQYDGSPLGQVWDELQSPNKFCIYRRPINTIETFHEISHEVADEPFSVMVYAVGYKVGYAYMAGYNVKNRTPILADNSTLDVIPDPNKGISLVCEDNQMTIFVNKSLVIDGLPSDVHLTDPYCFGRLVRTGSSQQWIRLTTFYTECGTIIQENESGSVYKNNLIYQGPKDDSVVIGRDATFTLNVSCTFEDRALASLRVRPKMSIMDGVLAGFGNLVNVTFTLKMYQSMSYKMAYRRDDFPVTVTVGKPMYLEAKASGGDQIQLLVDTCVATHSSNPRAKPNYIFLDNGCPTDETVIFYSEPESATQRFSIIAFSLSDGNNPTAVAYIHCWLIACNASDVSTRCQRDCSSREKRESTNAVESSDQFIVSWGPLIMLSESGRQHEEDITRDTKFQFAPLIVGVSFFVIGVAVSAIGIITFIRSRRRQHSPSRSWYDTHEDEYELLKMEDFNDESYE